MVDKNRNEIGESAFLMDFVDNGFEFSVLKTINAFVDKSK